MVGILAFACSGLRLDMVSGSLGGLLHGLWVVCFDVAVLVVLLCRGFVLLCEFAGLGVGWYVLCGVAGFGFVVGFRVWCFGILWLGCFFALT